ncbi:MAG: PD-(D/E)XK nuclease family protein, partial [Solirubrobacteraceae bacterium]
DNLILLHNNRIEKKHNNNAFYFLDLFNFFDSSLIKKAKEENEFIRLLKKNNRSFISISLINTHLKNSLYLTLLQDFTSALAFISILIDWLDNFIAENEKIFSAITLEALIHFHQLFKILLLETTKSEIAITFSSLSYLYNTLKNTNKIPFVGEPVTGLQILGMLETRLLNFEKIFILDVNEGIISPDNQQNSLVSFDFRKNFNLTTFKDRDAIYAYHFYRFLQNAKEVNLFYSEGISKMNNLEKSRFITQLEIESEHKINKIIATPNLSISYNENTVVEKTQTILNKIKEIYKKGVSPSSIKTYIRNPLDFYLIKILEIRENKEVELVMAQNSMGTVIHSCLQALYNEHLNKILLSLNFLEIKSKIHDVVEIIFKDNFKEGEILYGKNHLIFKVVLKIIEKIIETDEKLVKEGNELIIEALELKLEAPFLLNYNNEVVNFKGEIDRIDSLNGMKRILDYKTGNVDLADLTITAEKTEKITKDIKFENAVQLSIYTYLYLHNNKNVSNVIAGIYSVPNIKKGLLPLTINKISEIGMESLAPQLEKIRLLLIEILNAETPFIEDQKKYF